MNVKMGVCSIETNESNSVVVPQLNCCILMWCMDACFLAAWKMLVVIEGCSIQSQSQASTSQSGTSHF